MYCGLCSSPINLCRYSNNLGSDLEFIFSVAKTVTYDNAKFSLDSSLPQENGVKTDLPKETPENNPVDLPNDVPTNESTPKETLPDPKPMTNGLPPDVANDQPIDYSMKENGCEDNSPLSFNDNDSVNTSPEDVSTNEADPGALFRKVKYVEVCQKAFMNMYGITEKRIRWQREKLILKSRYLAEKKKKELEEMDRTLTLARSLGAGCQPLFALLEKSNCTHLSDQLMGAIEDDIALVNNFFHNQLWKPEDMMNKSLHFASPDSLETEM